MKLETHAVTKRYGAHAALDGASFATGDEARVIALACTNPPEGFDRWSLRLLEKHVLLTDGIPPLDHSTIGRVLKKGGFVLI